jgi:hypothetical protein
VIQLFCHLWPRNPSRHSFFKTLANFFCFDSVDSKIRNYQSICKKLSRYSHAGDKEERKYSSYSFLASAVGQRHASAILYPRERTPGIRWIGGWVGLRAGLDTGARGKFLCLCQGYNPGHLVCSQHYTD